MFGPRLLKSIALWILGRSREVTMKHLSCLGNVQAKVKGMVICFIAILLCWVASAPVHAGDNAGMLFPNGTITVNGVQTSSPIAVFPGDRIETGNSVAALTANGKVSFVNTKSSIVFNGQAASQAASKSNLGKIAAREDDEG